MKTIILSLLWIVLFNDPALTQITRLDEQELASLRDLNDHDRADTLLNWSYDRPERERSQIRLRASLEYALHAGHRKAQAGCFVKLGTEYMTAGRYAEARDWYEKARFIRDSLGLKKEVASCYNNLGLIEKKLGNYDAAVLLFRKGLQLLETDPSDDTALQLHNNLGATIRYQGKLEEALEHFKMAIALGGKLKSPYKSAQVRLNIANFLQDNLNRPEEALDSLNRCLADSAALKNKQDFIGKCYLALGNNAYQRGEYREALRHYNRALTSEPRLAKEDQAILLKNRGRVFLEQENYKSALADFQTGLDTFRVIGNKRETAATEFEIGNFYYEQRQWDDAVSHYKNALGVDMQDLGMKTRLLYFLSYALELGGRKQEAEAATEQYVQSLSRLDSTHTLQAFEQSIRYQLGKDRLHNRIVESEKKSITQFSIGGLGLAFLLSLLAVYMLRSYRHKQRLAERDLEVARQQEAISRQNEQIAIQENLDLLKNKELETNYARLVGQDEMQKKIGQELHDSVGAMLASVKLNLSPVDEVLDKLPEDNRRQYATANRLLSEASEEVRRISHQLSSAILQKFGLKAQLEALADVIPDSGKLQVELVTHGLKERLGYQTELQIYRMVQELVHNVIKHAKAKNISIQVNRFENNINLIVEDDGCGFEVEKLSASSGIGMQNLAARMHDLNGKMQIDSRPGRGTTVSIDIPLKS